MEMNRPIASDVFRPAMELALAPDQLKLGVRPPQTDRSRCVQINRAIPPLVTLAIGEPQHNGILHPQFYRDQSPAQTQVASCFQRMALA